MLYFKNELMKWADFLHADTNLGKLKVFFSYWVGIAKNGRDLIDHGTQKQGVSKIIWWIEQIEWFSHVDSNGITFGLMGNLLFVFDI